MPDITLCKGEECILKDTCYRYEGNNTPNELSQSYFLKPPFKLNHKKGTFECPLYWGVKQDDIMNYLKDIME